MQFNYLIFKLYIIAIKLYIFYIFYISNNKLLYKVFV